MGLMLCPLELVWDVAEVGVGVWVNLQETVA